MISDVHGTNITITPCHKNVKYRLIVCDKYRKIYEIVLNDLFNI